MSGGFLPSSSFELSVSSINELIIRACILGFDRHVNNTKRLARMYSGRRKPVICVGNSDLSVRFGLVDEVRELCLVHHYLTRIKEDDLLWSARWRKPLLVASLHDGLGRMAAAAVFWGAQAKWREPGVVELARVLEFAPDLSYERVQSELIDPCFPRILKKGYDLAIAYVERKKGNGGWHRHWASGWVYDGTTPASLSGGIVHRGCFIHGRTVNGIHGQAISRYANDKWWRDIGQVTLKGAVSTHSPALLDKLGIGGMEYSAGVSPGNERHRFWKSLTKEGKKKALRLGLKTKGKPQRRGPSTRLNIGTNVIG